MALSIIQTQPSHRSDTSPNQRNCEVTIVTCVIRADVEGADDGAPNETRAGSYLKLAKKRCICTDSRLTSLSKAR